MRAVINFATGDYVRGQNRLASTLRLHSPEAILHRWQSYPAGCPGHQASPYAFKAHCMANAANQGFDTLLWADACVMPIRAMEPLWQRIERDGYWICRNGWTNYEWTTQNAYRHLEVSPEENRSIPHVVATTFGVSLAHPTGKRIFDEYWRLSNTGALAGPWFNKNHAEYAQYPVLKFGRFCYDPFCAPCGPPDVRGHRHDQTALSVIVARAGCVLDSPPATFAYRGGETENTILVADSNY